MALESNGESEVVSDVNVADLLEQAQSTETNTAEPTTETSLPAGETSEETATEATTPGWKDKVAELGFQDVNDDSEAFERLAQAYAQRTEQERLYQQQMEQMRFQMQMLQHQQSQLQQPQTQTQQQEKTGYWNPPKVNPDLVNAYYDGRNEDGTIKWKPNTPPQVVADYTNEQEYYRLHADRLVKDWGSIESQLESRVLEKAQQMAQQMIEQTLAKQQAESFMQQQIQEHQDLLYQKDPVTNQLRYGYDGLPVLSEAGVKMQAILDQLAASGVQNESDRWRLAQQLYKAEHGELRQKQEDKVQQSRLAHLGKVTQRANGIPPRDGQNATRKQPPLELGQRLFANHDFKF